MNETAIFCASGTLTFLIFARSMVQGNDTATNVKGITTAVKVALIRSCLHCQANVDHFRFRNSLAS